MENYDSNMIKPVDSLQTITGLTPARRREQRKRRQQFESEEQEEKQNNNKDGTGTPDESLHIDDEGESKIDYRA
jgi:hypothetical protein